MHPTSQDHNGPGQRRPAGAKGGGTEGSRTGRAILQLAALAMAATWLNALCGGAAGGGL